MNKNFVITIILLLFNFLASASTGIAMPDSLRLISSKTGHSPVEFYIKNIIDERTVKHPAAKFLLSPKESKSNIQAEEIYDVGYEAIRDYMLQGLVRNTAARPVIVRIRDCNVRETLNAENRISGQVNLILQFDLEKESGEIPLTQYRSTAKYSRTFNNSGASETALKKLLSNSLTFFNNWMDTEVSQNIKLAGSVKISFEDYLDQDPDTVYYQASRPLVWDDFREKVPVSRYAAAVFPSFGYDLRRELINGIIHVNLAIKVYVVKSASWVSHHTLDSYSLNHEQRHFDLVKLVAERFKAKLISEKLNPDNYEGIINYEYLEFYREMNRLQQKYDQETNHGINIVKQEEWNRWINAQLNERFIAGMDSLNSR